jgi:4-hydroxy 2-oxovalerate aldolase
MSKDKVEYRRFEDLDDIAKTKENRILMLLGEKYDIRKLPMASGDCTLRISFHKKGAESGMKKVEEAIRRGYRVYIQPTATMFYSDNELEELLKKCNQLKPESVAIVDTFGQMKPKDVEEKVKIFDRLLDKDIAISFHAHNNLQNAYANAIKFIECASGDRMIVVDSSIYGMGRGAGNLPTELIMNYLNDSFGKKYNVEPLLTVVDNVITKMKKQHDWGYSLPYYLSGIYGVHPSYILTFMERKTLNSSDIRNLIETISDEKKSEFDLDYANGLYNSYNNRNVDDGLSRSELIKKIGEKPVLLVGPGKTLQTYRNAIVDYVDEKSPYVISVNGCYSIGSDAVFFSNKKRYEDLKETTKECALLLTSNIDADNECMMFNYGTYLARESGVSDNALLMVLNILKKIGIKKVTIAGFDGYISEKNFYKGTLELLLDKEYMDRLNKTIAANIDALGRDMEIVSLTPSKYFRKERK